MSKEKAKEFIEKAFTDDEFAIKVLQAGDFKPGGGDDKDPADRGMENFVKAGKALDYDFTDEEAEGALKEYMESIGTWKAIRKVMHFARLNKKARKSMGK